MYTNRRFQPPVFALHHLGCLQTNVALIRAVSRRRAASAVGKDKNAPWLSMLTVVEWGLVSCMYALEQPQLLLLLLLFPHYLIATM